MGHLPRSFPIRTSKARSARESELAEEFSEYEANTIEGSGPVGIACGGISYAYVKEAIAGHEDQFTVLKIATPYPFP